jgi:hypothetical protein
MKSYVKYYFTLASLSADNGTHQRKKQIGRLNSGSREAPSRPHACPLDSSGRARSRMPQPTAPDIEGARRTRHSIPATTAALQALGLLKRPPIREDLKVLIYQFKEADNTFITSDGTSPYNSTR